MSTLISQFLPPSPFCPVTTSVPYICVCIPALQTGSPVPFFSEKAMAPHSSTLAWKIPRMEEPGRLQSTGSRRVGHNWAASLSLFTFLHWRRKWQPTPVFLPGESQGRGSLMGCRLWGRTWLKRLSSSSSSTIFLDSTIGLFPMSVSLFLCCK